MGEGACLIRTSRSCSEGTRRARRAGSGTGSRRSIPTSSGTSRATRWPTSRTRGSGRNEFVAHVTKYWSLWNDYSQDVKEMIDEGDNVVVVLREHARLRNSDVGPRARRRGRLDDPGRQARALSRVRRAARTRSAGAPRIEGSGPPSRRRRASDRPPKREILSRMTDLGAVLTAIVTPFDERNRRQRGVVRGADAPPRRERLGRLRRRRHDRRGLDADRRGAARPDRARGRRAPAGQVDRRRHRHQRHAPRGAPDRTRHRARRRRGAVGDAVLQPPEPRSA